MFLPAQPTQVISHIKRTFTLRTKCLWLLGGNSCSASRTLKMFYLWHSRTIAAHESPRQAASKQVFCALLVLGLNRRFSAMMSVLNRLFARHPLATRQLPPIQAPACHRTGPLLRGLPAARRASRSQISHRPPLPRLTLPRRSRPPQSLAHLLDLLRHARRSRTRPRLTRVRHPTPRPQRHLPPSHQSHRRSAHPGHTHNRHRWTRRPSQSRPHRLEKSRLFRSRHYHCALSWGRGHQSKQSRRRSRNPRDRVRTIRARSDSTPLDRLPPPHFS